jgi:hypothetical protein
MKLLARVGLSALLMPFLLCCTSGFAASFDAPGAWCAAYTYALGGSTSALLMTGIWLGPRGKLQN